MTRTASDRIQTLFDAFVAYTDTLTHPGQEAVAAGLHRPFGAPIVPTPKPHPLIDAWLPTALAAVDDRARTLADAIADAAPVLSWITYDRYPEDEIGQFPTHHAYAKIVGSDSPFPAEDFDAGVFLMIPHTLYRDHKHAAHELYAPITGPHGWRFGTDAPFHTKPAHTPVWNPPYQPHMTKVGSVPFLCMFVWTKDVSEPATVIPATDWADLEALRLGN
jgi:hypothetical protein